MTDTSSQNPETNPIPYSPARRKPSALQRGIFLVFTALCFAYLYYRLNGAAMREGMGLVDYMSQVFSNVSWLPWLLLMMSYSVIYFAIDTLVITKALNWFIAPIKYRDIMPIRGSAYIISIFNEQVGKGAMAYYLNKRDKVPGWETGSVMLFMMFCEIFYLMIWATLGFVFTTNILPDVFGLIPYIAAAACVFLVLWMLYFQGKILPNSTLRDKRILHAFKLAKPWHYGAFFLLRSPAIILAIVVYSAALNLFGVEVNYLTMIGVLPVIFFAAAVPTPMRAAAITLWVVLFPENEGQMAAFGFVQHNFFILFNAAIGLLFWRRAQRELFGT